MARRVTVEKKKKHMGMALSIAVQIGNANALWTDFGVR